MQWPQGTQGEESGQDRVRRQGAVTARSQPKRPIVTSLVLHFSIIYQHDRIKSVFEMLFSWGNIRKAGLSFQLCFYFFSPFIYDFFNQADTVLEIVHVNPGAFFFLPMTH